ncbi:Bug family tripartite tricarboxylate transporter substrate binding protein [Falsiroseomonas oryziterrae]|uniref:Bug family tripartite tricarboxylate transporter substrate binding protein n=1 Tax=Falsiroseomonas oryziterrae TaxID=2911368 RepID=UPI001F327370|nr:tripartite tricarboxylate transporter substrate binding protein [Roseomonas sp. NPKOSM-4]
MPVITRRAALGASLLLAAPAVAQQGWPSRPIRIIAPFPPGGLVDVLPRAIAPTLSARLGQPVVVENRPGANGNIGADLVAKSPPDGYTLLATSLGPIATNQYIYASMPFDTDTAFAPIVLLARTPKVMCVATARPWRSVQEVIDAARARPGTLTAGSAGNGSSLHIALELFKRATGTDIQHVPYRGAAPAVTDLVAGQIDLVIDNLPNILGQIAAGAVRAVGMGTERRAPQLPNLPTMREQGVEFVFGTAFGLAAPAGTPEPILARLAALTTEALRDPAIGGRLAEQGAELGGGTPSDFAALIAREKATQAPVIRAAGIRAD